MAEAAAVAVPVSAATRELCAARLLSTLDAVSRVSRPRPVSSGDLPVRRLCNGDVVADGNLLGPSHVSLV